MIHFKSTHHGGNSCELALTYKIWRVLKWVDLVATCVSVIMGIKNLASWQIQLFIITKYSAIYN